jgi:hypothetical protein
MMPATANTTGIPLLRAEIGDRFFDQAPALFHLPVEIVDRILLNASAEGGIERHVALPLPVRRERLAVSQLVPRLGKGTPMRDNTGRSGGCGSVGIYSPLLTEGFARPPSPGVPCLSVVAGTNTLGCGSKPTRPPFSRAKVWAAVPFQALSPEVKPNDGDDHERQQDENQDREAVHSIDSQFRQSLRVIYRVASPAKENPARIAPSGVVGVRGDLVQHAIE